MRSAAWRTYALGGSTGALYFLAFEPYRVGPLAWLALVPLVLTVRRAARLRQALLAGASAGFVTCAGGYFWIAGMAHRFWEVNWAFAALLLAIFATFGEISFLIFAGLAWRMRRRLAVLPAAATAALFTLCEIFIPKIFPDALGHSQVDTPMLPYAAALVGVRGLSFFIAWFAAALAWYGDRAQRTRAQRRAELVLSILAACGLFAFGAWRHAALQAQPPARQLDVVIVQSNLGDPEAVAAQLGGVTKAIDSTLTLYMDLTREALATRSADLVVWPETAVPAVPREPILARLRLLVHDVDTPLVYGGYDVERIENNRWRLYNAAYFMAPSGEVRQRYYKHKLLLLGEYVPFSERFPALLNMLPMPGEFTPGPGPQVFQIDGVAFTPLICYELLFPNVVRTSLRAGGEVLLNLTNDYWFGPYGEPRQHLAMCRMCAFETGRPIVRATNTGMSAFIDAGGQILEHAGVWKQAVLHGTLPIPPMHWTPFARWGSWTTAGAMVAALLLVLLTWKLVPANVAVPDTNDSNGDDAHEVVA